MTSTKICSRRRWSLVAGLVLGPVVMAGGALARITNVAGLVTQIPAPPSVRPAAGPTGPFIQAFNERQNVRLQVPLPVDATPSGPPKEIDSPDKLNPGEIQAGVCVNSYYFWFDPTEVNRAIGSAAFDGRVLGVIVLPETLDATNVLGRPQTLYPVSAGTGPCLVGNATCGLELSAKEDAFTIGGSNINMNLNALTPGDRMRVITEGDNCCPASTCPGETD